MPAKNRIKEYVENGYYHMYNRGVEKRVVFVDAQDYAVFLSYIKTYLTPKDAHKLEGIFTSESSTQADKEKARTLLRMNNFYDHIDLVSFCLMPNHFHFLVHQKEPETIDRFMNSLGTRYSMYFNRKYKRVGPLFQGLYKAVLIDSDEQLIHVSRYIHRNPASKGRALREYEYSSYPDFLGKRNTSWVSKTGILSLPYFAKKGSSSYEMFVEDTQHDETSLILIKNITLDYEN